METEQGMGDYKLTFIVQNELVPAIFMGNGDSRAGLLVSSMPELMKTITLRTQSLLLTFTSVIAISTTLPTTIKASKVFHASVK